NVSSMKTNHPDSVARLSRRGFLQTSVAASTIAALSGPSSAAGMPLDALPAPFRSLKPLGSRVKPIPPDEFRQRLAKAQNLMAAAQPKFDALFFAPGTSLYYFTGIHWGLSERLLALVLPRAGDPVLVVPGFEEGRLREQLKWPIEVRVWQEDQ